VRIEYMPGMACGTGAHPATQLCLAAIDRYVRAGDAVVDVGAGSGILSRGALVAGAGRVIACDIDWASAVIAHANVPEALCYAGSTRSLPGGCADVAVANLNAATLTALAAELRRIARVLILSGFERNDADAVARVLAPARTLSDGAWRCFVIEE
jgi:ribosomal protein L11 methyltransferase